ncbi:hypothetical protein RhiirB3_455200 [Rhizophagus irregularis]|nr:hypothetical protein RhiirB3_455200 [Rhizophagus irregularis]
MLYHAKNYLWEIFTSLLKRFQRDFSSPPSTPSSTPIVYIFPLAFPIRQVTRLPIRIPSEEFWNNSHHKLDAFLDTFRNLPASQQLILNMEDNFHFGLIYRTDNLL